MYTTKEQVEELLANNIIADGADMVCFAGKSKKDPYKKWNPVSKIEQIEKESALPKEQRKLDSYDPKVWMPAWSEDGLFKLLPRVILDPDTNNEYELYVTRKEVPGLGMYVCVSYNNTKNGTIYRAFMHQNMTEALCRAIIAIICSDKIEKGNLIW